VKTVAQMDRRELGGLRNITTRTEQWDEQTNALTAGRPNVHVEIARMTGNPMLELCLATLFAIATDAGARRMPAPAAAQMRAADVDIVDALDRGDSEAAQRRLRQLVELLKRYNEGNDPTVGVARR
jgi:DNA-binding FadR family transcriptional regulator